MQTAHRIIETADPGEQYLLCSQQIIRLPGGHSLPADFSNHVQDRPDVSCAVINDSNQFVSQTSIAVAPEAQQCLVIALVLTTVICDPIFIDPFKDLCWTATHNDIIRDIFGNN